MSFDIKVHILDHAHTIIDNLKSYKNNNGLIHFNSSVDSAYFINQGYDTQEKIDNIMTTILKNITKIKLSVEEKNGNYINKQGVKRQKYRIREIKFDKLLSVYHNRHFDASKSVNPHFHFLFNKKDRVGKGYIYLREALQIEANKFGIKFNFMEDKQENGLNQQEAKMIKRLSWHLHQGDRDKLEKYFKNSNLIQKHIETLIKHYQYTHNLSFFIKTISILQQRLQELDIDYFYKDTNVKKNLFFFLTSSQKEKIIKLQNNQNIKLDLSKVLDREILKYTYGFSSEVMNILVDKFKLPTINKENIEVIDNQKQLLSKDTKIKNPNSNNFRKMIIQDIRNAISKATNEKNFKKLLLSSKSYQKIITKTQKGSNNKRNKIGFEVITQKNSRLFISLSELKLNWSKITKILMYNTKKNKNTKTFISKITTYSKIQKKPNEELTKYEHRVKLLLEIYYKNNQIIDTSIEQIKKLAYKYQVDKSDMYNITTYSNFKKDTTIIDYGDKISLKKTFNISKAISDMLDIAQIKGWSLELLEIKGNQVFIDEAKKNIKQRLCHIKNKNISMVRLS